MWKICVSNLVVLSYVCVIVWVTIREREGERVDH